LVKVHVWLPNGTHVGHAALTVGNDYISFWPDGGAEKKDLKIKRSQHIAFAAQQVTQQVAREGVDLVHPYSMCRLPD